MKKILLVGAGNMGSAIAKALLSKNIVTNEYLYIADPSDEKLKFFSQKGCHTSCDPEDFIPFVDIIILATKPQNIRELLSQWKELFVSNQVLLSIAAGVPVSEIKKYSGQEKIVRIMPNTPLLVEEGVSGYYFSPAISREEKEYILPLIESFGLAIECENEEKINSITALSGSGPAYFFNLLHGMSEQGQKWGFSVDQSEKIALHTLIGAGKLALSSSKNFNTLKNNVTSKGGTTEAALTFFEENNFLSLFAGGMIAAKKRSEEL